MNIQSFLKKTAFLVGVFIFLFGIQLGYFVLLYKNLNTQPSQDFDLVITYSDEAGMEPALQLALTHHKPLYVSQAHWEANPFKAHPQTELAEVHIDPVAETTDQNARHATAFIEQGGYKKVVLDVGWFHVPRALFLTRLYLLGSGVEVIPCAKTPLPDHWWTKRLFFNELYKFWGSLGRVALAFVGYETGPKGPPR